MNRIVCYIIIFALASLFSCTEVRVGDPKVLMQKELERRIAEFNLEQMRSCKEEALYDAETYVDSVLFSEANVELLDSVSMIVKPAKPYRPDYIKDIDTSAITPFFDRNNTISLDSI